MDYLKWIEDYGMDVNDFDVSAFESVNMLHTRSKIEKVITQLTNEEKLKLVTYDMMLIKNAKKMAEHIGELYDFSLSNEPLSEWWWHLDKVAKEEISFYLSAGAETNLAI